MASNSQQNSFWDFVRSMDQGANANVNQNGEGVDRPAPIPGTWAYGYGNSSGHWPYPPPPPPPAAGHEGPEPPHGPEFTPGFPFGGGLFGQHGHPHATPPAGFGPDFPFGGGVFGHRGHRHRGGPFGGPSRGGCHGRGGRRGRHGRREGRHGERGENENDNDNDNEGEQHGPMGAFDLSGLLASLASHPLAQPYRQFLETLAAQASGQDQRSGEMARDAGEGENENENEDDTTFTPPIDVFTTTTEYVLHVALPGAKKEDVGINWDAEKGVLNVAGVIYRQGDEEFLRQLTQSERKVGVFERAVRLPPRGREEKEEEVDGDGITAKLEDGVLVVRVPKVEREWTDVKKVDIQ